MSGAAKSIFVFGIYVLIGGLGFTFVPNVLLEPLGEAPVPEPWVRVLGVLMVGISLYYMMMGKLETRSLFVFTVAARVWVCVAFTGLVAFGVARPSLLPFGFIDLAGAIWTGVALKAGERPAA
jgi:hypothetical protein